MSLPPWRQTQSVQTLHSQPLRTGPPGSHIDSAYTPVGARRGFEAPPPAMAPAPIYSKPTMPVVAPESRTASAKKMAWPQSVRDYVQRTFDHQHLIPGIEKEEVERKLKNIINEAAAHDSLHTVDWGTFPLPQQVLEEERRRTQAMTTPINVPGFGPILGQANSVLSAADRKRKSGDISLDQPDQSAPPPWRQNSSRNPLEDRLTFATQEQADRLDKRQRKVNDKATSKYSSDLEKRRQRFQNGKHQPSSPEGRTRASSPDLVDQGPVIGTCQTLEKKYFRLTSAPKPETVRPLPILRQTLDLLKQKWKHENKYGYICDQFKSLRQDLTVQHIKNEFTVTVYEIHARIALEQGDLGEYNQCQTQLRALYSQNLGGNPAEFLAYRILYIIHTNNRGNMNDVLADLTETDKKQPYVAHALKVRSALALGNYHKFFQLYHETPNMGAYLMDMFIQRERLAALANICRAFKPDVPLRFVTEELGFESDQQCAEFILEFQGESLLVEKDGVYRFAAAKAGHIFENARAAAFQKVDIKGQI